MSDGDYDTLHGYAEMNGKLVAELEALRAENAKLRHMLDAETDQARKDVVYFDELRAENERLQAKCEFIYDELLEAKGQVVKLRAVLTPFAGYHVYDTDPDDEYTSIEGITVGDLRAARAALESDNE